jgi:hypothetical protein
MTSLHSSPTPWLGHARIDALFCLCGDVGLTYIPMSLAGIVHGQWSRVNQHDWTRQVRIYYRSPPPLEWVEHASMVPSAHIRNNANFNFKT